MARLVLLAEYKKSVREVQLDTDTAERLSAYFEDQVTEYQALSVSPYEPGYKPREDEVLELTFALPVHLAQYAEAAPADSVVLTEQELKRELPKALVAVLYGTETRFAFQAIDRRNVLGVAQGRIGGLLWGRENFSLTKEPVLIPNDGLDAIFVGGKLLFRNDWVVRRFLNMEEHFREATDEDLAKFFTDKVFIVRDWSALKAVAGTMIRRRLSRLVARGETYAPAKLQAAAKRAKVKLAVQDDLIVVPSATRDLRDLVDLLDDAYLESLLDQSRCYVTNSKRLVK